MKVSCNVNKLFWLRKRSFYHVSVLIINGAARLIIFFAVIVTSRMNFLVSSTCKNNFGFLKTPFFNMLPKVNRESYTAAI